MPQIKKLIVSLIFLVINVRNRKTVNVEILLAEYKQQSSKQSTLY